MWNYIKIFDRIKDLKCERKWIIEIIEIIENNWKQLKIILKNEK